MNDKHLIQEYFHRGFVYYHIGIRSAVTEQNGAVFCLNLIVEYICSTDILDVLFVTDNEYSYCIEEQRSGPGYVGV